MMECLPCARGGVGRFGLLGLPRGRHGFPHLRRGDRGSRSLSVLFKIAQARCEATLPNSNTTSLPSPLLPWSQALVSAAVSPSPIFAKEGEETTIAKWTRMGVAQAAKVCRAPTVRSRCF